MDILLAMVKILLKTMIIPVLGIIENWALGTYLLVNYSTSSSGSVVFSFGSPGSIGAILFYLLAWVAGLSGLLLFIGQFNSWRKGMRF